MGRDSAQSRLAMWSKISSLYRRGPQGADRVSQITQVNSTHKTTSAPGFPIETEGKDGWKLSWYCPALWLLPEVLRKEAVVGGTSCSHCSQGLGGNQSRVLAGPPRGPGRGSCPELSVQGGGREAATRSSPCASPWGQAGSACWLHPEPAPRDAGGGSQDQSRRLRIPLPQQQGTKVGQGGRRGPRRAGGGGRSAREGTQGEGTRGGCLEKQNHVCSGPWGARQSG